MKHKIKILELTASYTDSYDYLQYAVEGITDWEEVDDEQYTALVNWAQRKSLDEHQSRMYYRNHCIVVVRQSEYSAKRAFSEYMEMMKEEEEKERKNKEKAKKAAATRKRRELDKKRRQLEKLKAELGE